MDISVPTGVIAAATVVSGVPTAHVSAWLLHPVGSDTGSVLPPLRLRTVRLTVAPAATVIVPLLPMSVPPVGMIETSVKPARVASLIWQLPAGTLLIVATP